MEKIDSTITAVTDQKHPRLRRVNKSLIIYSIFGVIAAGIIGSTVVYSLPGRSKADRGRSTMNVPDPPEYRIDYDSDTADPVGELTVPPAPVLTGLEGVEPFDFAKSDDDAPTAAAAPNVSPSAPAPLGYQAPAGFNPDFSEGAAKSSMAVAVEESSLYIPTVGARMPGGTLERMVESAGNRAVSIPTTIPNNRQPTAYELYNQANQQDEKRAFAAPTGQASISEVLGPYSIAQGTVIPASLVTGINTDLPGYIMAQVSENVYDFISGDNLLIPAGSRLVASYNSVVSWGQTRIQVSWQQMIRPDGTVVNLAGAPGIDAAGYSGLPARVDNHSLEILGAIGFSALTTFMTGAADAAVENLLNKGALSASLESVVSNLGNIGYTIAQRWLNVQPTLTLKSGSKVNVFATNSITLPPAEPAGEVRKYTRRR